MPAHSFGSGPVKLAVTGRSQVVQQALVSMTLPWHQLLSTCIKSDVVCIDLQSCESGDSRKRGLGQKYDLCRSCRTHEEHK